MPNFPPIDLIREDSIKELRETEKKNRVRNEREKEKFRMNLDSISQCLKQMGLGPYILNPTPYIPPKLKSQFTYRPPLESTNNFYNYLHM